MKYASLICIGLLVFWVLIAILDMWFDIIGTAVFIKLTVTLGLIMVVVLALALAKREYVDQAKLRKDKDID